MAARLSTLFGARQGADDAPPGLPSVSMSHVSQLLPEHHAAAVTRCHGRPVAASPYETTCYRSSRSRATGLRRRAAPMAYVMVRPSHPCPPGDSQRRRLAHRIC